MEMKLVKINKNHYVVVDDSEIKDGDYFLNENNTIEGYIDNYPFKILSPKCKKITHSTEPLEYIGHHVTMGWQLGFDKIKPLTLPEVKAIIGEMDLDKKVIEWYNQAKYDSSFIADPYSYKSGYNQAIEDNKEKKYTEEDVFKIIKIIRRDSWALQHEILQELQPKSEWEVEFVDGKLNEKNNQVKNIMEKMNKLKVLEIGNDAIYFENNIKLFSFHESDCCEQHELDLKDLTIEEFDGLEFDLTNDNFFKRIPDYGIELIPIYGHSVKIAGHGFNNGYYSDQLDLIIEQDGKEIKRFDITECQVTWN